MPVRNDQQWLLLHGCVPSVYRRLLKSELGSFITDYFQVVLNNLLAYFKIWSLQLCSIQNSLLQARSLQVSFLFLHRRFWRSWFFFFNMDHIALRVTVFMGAYAKFGIIFLCTKERLLTACHGQEGIRLFLFFFKDGMPIPSFFHSISVV